MAALAFLERKKVRKFLEKLYVEVVIISVVMLYAIVIFAQLIVSDDEMSPEMLEFMTTVDIVFLTIFMVEILIKLYAFGMTFVKDAYNLVDAVVVIASFILTIIASSDVGGAASDQASLLRILRLARIFRVILIMNKIQRSRESAHLLRKRAMYRKIGAPVEKVLECLVEMKDRVESSDQDNLNWIIEVIAADQLYTVNMNNDNETDVDNEMSAWLNQNANLTNKKGAAKKGDDAGDDGGVPGAVNGASRAADSDQPHLWVDESLKETAVSATLSKILRWEFDVFELDRVSNHHPLIFAAYHLVQTQGLLSEFEIPHQKFLNFWTKIEQGYKNNPYHNATHGADVLISTNYYMLQPSFKNCLTPLDILAGIISGGIHDFEHPGFNNAFIQNTKGELAVLYNDMSVLENHHVAAAWRLLLKEDSSFLENLDQSQYVDLRETVITSVLGTDMKHHFEHLTKFKTKMASDSFANAANDKKDMRLIMMMAVHCGDTSNPLKPFKTSVEWSMRVMEEFFMQGDKEKELGLPTSPFMDREKTSVAQCQIGFINVLVKPLHAEFCQFLGDQAVEDCMTCVAENVSKWEQEGNNLLDRDFSKAPPQYVQAREEEVAKKAAEAAEAAAAAAAAKK